MIEKLELKHLCGYLPHKLEMIFEKSGRIIKLDGIQRTDGGNLIYSCGENYMESTIWNFKPLLLPLSALEEPMEDGSVPIIELAKMAKFYNNKDQKYFVNTETFTYGCSGQEYNFWFYSDGSFNATKLLYNNNEFVGEEVCIISNQLQLFEYLYSKHFDIHSLIPAGLAIDKRTIK